MTPAADGDDDLGDALSGLRLVVVEDDPDTLELVRELLTQAGADVTPCRNAFDALDRVRTLRPDLLVSDIGLPGRDGLWLIREVRRLRPQEGGATPAVALTAYARPEDREQTLRAGFQRHVAKPIDPPDLVRVLLALHRAGDVVVDAPPAP